MGVGEIADRALWRTLPQHRITEIVDLTSAPARLDLLG
jgi:hypothetical protein